MDPTLVFLFFNSFLSSVVFLFLNILKPSLSISSVIKSVPSFGRVFFKTGTGLGCGN